jgi:hypothetical protein
MPITVTMLQTRQGEGGVTWTAGNSYSASDAFGAYLISSNLATGTIPVSTPSNLTAAQVTATQALVSGGGKAVRRAQHQREALTAATAQASAWAATTAYVVTDIVRLTTGELLVCTTAGTSAGSTPTITAGSAPAEITDGTVRWHQLAEITRAAPAGVPVVAVAPTAGNTALGTIVNLYDTPGSFDQLSAVNQVTAGGSGNTKYSSAWAFTDGGGQASDAQLGSVAGRRGQYRTAEFVTQADLIEVGYFAINAGILNERVRIWVDGFSVSEAPLIQHAQGASGFFRLTIPGGRRQRRVRIACSGYTNLRYIGVASDCTVVAPSQRSLLMGWFSDSWGDTEVPNIASAHYDLAPQVAVRLGFPHLMHGGVGGTSYSLANGSARGLAAMLPLNDWSGYSFDAIVTAHGFNAANNAVAPATECASALSSWQFLRARWPNAPILVVNSWYRHPSATAAQDAMVAALQAQFLAWGDTNSAIINPQDGSITRGGSTVIRAATGAWVTTAIAAWAMNATDTFHPTPAGRAYLTDCMTQAGEAALAVLMV